MYERLRSIFMLQCVELEVDLKQDYVDIGILCDLAPPYKNLRCVTVCHHVGANSLCHNDVIMC